jgi:hypothetical protein
MLWGTGKHRWGSLKRSSALLSLLQGAPQCGFTIFFQRSLLYKNSSVLIGTFLYCVILGVRMVHRQRKTEIDTFSKEALMEAVQLVQDGRSVCKAARIKGLKLIALFWNVRKRKTNCDKMG